MASRDIVLAIDCGLHVELLSRRGLLSRLVRAGGAVAGLGDTLRSGRGKGARGGG